MELLEYLEQLEHRVELLLPLMDAFDQYVSLDRLNEILTVADENLSPSPPSVGEALAG